MLGGKTVRRKLPTDKQIMKLIRLKNIPFCNIAAFLKMTNNQLLMVLNYQYPCKLSYNHRVKLLKLLKSTFIYVPEKKNEPVMDLDFFRDEE